MPQPPFPLRPALRQRLGRLGEEFLVSVYGQETTRNPGNLEALAELAHVLTRMGRLEEGLALDRRLAELAPDNPTVHYNLACSLALLDRPAAALDALEKSVEFGYGDADHLVADEDLRSLHEEARFKRLVRVLQARQP